MGVRVFVATNTGNKEIENGQQTIFQVLKTRNIEYETIDIAAPGMQEQRKFMREKGKKKDGQRFALPPQIFNGEEYRGNFEDFDIANEDDMLEEFLGKERQNPKVEPVKTGAVAPEVGRLKPGKLEKNFKEKFSGNVKKNKDKGSQAEDSSQDSNGNSTTDCDNESNWSESVNDLDTDSGFKDETDSLESKSDTEGDDIDKDAHAPNPNLAENCEKAGRETDGSRSSADRDSGDKLGDNLVILDEGLDLMNGEDDDSSDYDSSSDEDDATAQSSPKHNGSQVRGKEGQEGEEGGRDD